MKSCVDYHVRTSALHQNKNKEIKGNMHVKNDKNEWKGGTFGHVLQISSTKRKQTEEKKIQIWLNLTLFVSKVVCVCVCVCLSVCLAVCVCLCVCCLGEKQGKTWNSHQKQIIYNRKKKQILLKKRQMGNLCEERKNSKFNFEYIWSIFASPNSRKKTSNVKKIKIWTKKWENRNLLEDPLPETWFLGSSQNLELCTFVFRTRRFFFFFFFLSWTPFFHFCIFQHFWVPHYSCYFECY